MGNDGRLTLQPIATIENDFPTKFGVPRQKRDRRRTTIPNCLSAGIPSGGSLSRPEGFFTFMADLGVF